MNEQHRQEDDRLEAECAALAARLRAVPERSFRSITADVMCAIERRRRWRRNGWLSLGTAAAAAVLALAVFSSGQGSVSGGGTAEPALADVETPVEWLLAAQEADGMWDPTRWGGSGIHPHAVTGFAMMALASDEERAHDADVARAVWALRAGQSPEGRLSGPDDRNLLNHAIATAALLRLYGTGRFPESFTVLDGALNHIRQAQDATGGWGGGVWADVWLVDVLGRARALGWQDRGGHLRRGIRRLELARAPVGPAIASSPTLTAKIEAVSEARKKWIAVNPGVRGGGRVYAQAMAAL